MGHGAARETPGAYATGRHVVQIYPDETFLRDAVSDWAAAPLCAGGGALVIAGPAHATLVREGLAARGLDVAALEREGRLRFVDADGMMSRFLVDGMPDRSAFLDAASAAVAAVRSACGVGEIRAWGEMVDLLRKRGAPAAAVALESLWNEVVADHGIRLLCSYEGDILASETHEVLKDLCHGHDRLLPEPDEVGFGAAVARALSDVFGDREANGIRAIVAARRSMPTEMQVDHAVLVGLHEIQPTLARRVLQTARVHLTASRRVTVP